MVPRSVEGQSHVLATAAVQVFAVTLRINAFDDTKCYKRDCLLVVIDVFEVVQGIPCFCNYAELARDKRNDCFRKFC